MTKYRPVKGSTLNNTDAEVIGSTLEAIERTNGRVTARLVVDEATPPESPIHKYFEWDEAAAADKYRISQAQKLIRSVSVTVRSNGEPIPVRAFTHVRADDVDGYRSTARVMSVEEHQQQAIARALAEFVALRRKFANLVALRPVFSVIDEFVVEYEDVLDAHHAEGAAA